MSVAKNLWLNWCKISCYISQNDFFCLFLDIYCIDFADSLCKVNGLSLCKGTICWVFWNISSWKVQGEKTGDKKEMYAGKLNDKSQEMQNTY